MHIKGTVSRDFRPIFFFLKDSICAPNEQAKTVSQTFSFSMKIFDRKVRLCRHENFSLDTNVFIFLIIAIGFVRVNTPKNLFSPDCSFKICGTPSKFSFHQPVNLSFKKIKNVGKIKQVQNNNLKDPNLKMAVETAAIECYLHHITRTVNLNELFIENNLRIIGSIMQNIERINNFNNDREEGGEVYIKDNTILGIMAENDQLFNLLPPIHTLVCRSRPLLRR